MEAVFNMKQAQKVTSPELLTLRTPRSHQARIGATTRTPGYMIHPPSSSDQDVAPRPSQKCAHLQRRLWLRSARSRRSRLRRPRPPERKLWINSCQSVVEDLVWLVSVFWSGGIFQLKSIFDDGLDIGQESSPLAQWTLDC